MNFSEDPASRKKKLPHWFWPAMGYVFAIVCLIWVFHGVDFARVKQDFSTLDWRYVVLAVSCDLGIYFCGGWRWRVLLSPVSLVSYWRAVQSIYIGLFANEVLPLRTGEVIRCYLLSYWGHVPLSLSISAAAIERILDGIWLVLTFYAASYLVDLPGYLVEFARLLAILILAVCAVLAVIVFWKHHAHRIAARSKWVAGLERIIEGLHTMGNRRTIAAALAISFLYLVLQIVPVWALMKGYGLDLNIGAATTVLVITRLGTVVPNAPGNVGSFQAFCVLALGLFQVDKTDAAGFSLVLFGVLTLPLLIGGLIAVLLSGLNLNEIRERAHRSVHSHTAPVTER